MLNEVSLALSTSHMIRILLQKALLLNATQCGHYIKNRKKKKKKKFTKDDDFEHQSSQSHFSRMFRRLLHVAPRGRCVRAMSTSLQMPSSVQSVRVPAADGAPLTHDASLDESGKFWIDLLLLLLLCVFMIDLCVSIERNLTPEKVVAYLDKHIVGQVRSSFCAQFRFFFLKITICFCFQKVGCKTSHCHCFAQSLAVRYVMSYLRV
jgi:hypothetical protein